MYVAESKSTFKTSQGRLKLKADPGRYTLRITAPGYVAQGIGISVADKDGLLSKSIELAPEITRLTVRSEPEATAVLVDSEGNALSLGQVDELGELVFEDTGLGGVFDLIISKPEYSTFELHGYALEGVM